jgi:hypothetical protein
VIEGRLTILRGKIEDTTKEDCRYYKGRLQILQRKITTKADTTRED